MEGEDREDALPSIRLGFFLICTVLGVSYIEDASETRDEKTVTAQWKRCEETVDALQKSEVEGSAPKGTGPLFL